MVAAEVAALTIVLVMAARFWWKHEGGGFDE